MNVRSKGAFARSKRFTPEASAGKQQADHAEIVHMAEVEAANRASQRCAMVARAAYFRAQHRGFEPGHELEDWFAAEVEVTNAQQLSTLSPAEETASP
jgi:hypothetical protein